MIACHLLITGLVQGVFFRASTEQKAKESGLTGWVRNTDDGAVEVHAEGPENVLNEFIEWCKKGPPKARVDSVKMTKTKPEHFSSFEIMR